MTKIFDGFLAKNVRKNMEKGLTSKGDDGKIHKTIKRSAPIRLHTV